MSGDSDNPLLARLRDGLSWPAWNSWPDEVEPNPPPVCATGPVNVAERAAEVQRRRALARTTDRGGPWLELFDDAVAARLADEADRDLGPLAMQTFAIKGLVAVAGRRMTAGSPVRADAPVERATAPFVEQLQALGAIAAGTVTMHEFAFGVTGVNPHAGTAPNPAAPDRVPGGSSSGSASAVADGSASFAIGTDTGGSVRIPSAFCGIAGFKPAHGTYPAAGVFPLSVTLDHVGLHAGTVAEIARIHGALGHRVETPALPRRLGIARPDLDHADAAVRDPLEAALDQLEGHGVELVDITWPDAELAFIASTGIMFSEAAAIHAKLVAAHGPRYGADIKARLELGAELSGAEVAASHRIRHELIGRVLRSLAGVDLIASPTVPIVAPRLADADDPSLAPRIVANTRLGNVVGLPALTVPVATDGPPVGMQLLGRDNAAALAGAEAIEMVLDR